MRDEGALTLATSTSITRLDLRANGISDAGAQGFKLNRTLLSLNISDNFILPPDEKAIYGALRSNIAAMKERRSLILQVMVALAVAKESSSPTPASGSRLLALPVDLLVHILGRSARADFDKDPADLERFFRFLLKDASDLRARIRKFHSLRVIEGKNGLRLPREPCSAKRCSHQAEILCATCRGYYFCSPRCVSAARSDHKTACKVEKARRKSQK